MRAIGEAPPLGVAVADPALAARPGGEKPPPRVYVNGENLGSMRPAGTQPKPRGGIPAKPQPVRPCPFGTALDALDEHMKNLDQPAPDDRFAREQTDFTSDAAREAMLWGRALANRNRRYGKELRPPFKTLAGAGAGSDEPRAPPYTAGRLKASYVQTTEIYRDNVREPGSENVRVPSDGSAGPQASRRPPGSRASPPASPGRVRRRAPTRARAPQIETAAARRNPITHVLHDRDGNVIDTMPFEDVPTPSNLPTSAERAAADVERARRWRMAYRDMQRREVHATDGNLTPFPFRPPKGPQVVARPDETATGRPSLVPVLFPTVTPGPGLPPAKAAA